MQLLLLGTSGYHPAENRQTACLMLPELGLVLDAGTGFHRVGDHVATPTLDVFLTHAHLDHVIGITFLFDVAARHDLERVTVHAEAPKLEAIREHLLAESLFPAAPPCDFAPLSGQGVPLPRGGQLSCFPLEHPGGSIGFRLDWPDRSLAYVTDTTAEAAADYVETIEGVDVLVHECFFPDDMPEKAALTGHSCLTPVCEVAAAANVGLLLLVHLNPLADEHAPVDLAHAQSLFANTIVGEDHMQVEF